MIREIIGCTLIGAGLFAICMAIVGVFRFQYVLNRMHAAALCDTLGLLLSLTGLIVLCGLSWQSAKMVLIILFMWLANPVMSHLIAKAEVMTHAHLRDECEVQNDDDRF